MFCVKCGTEVTNGTFCPKCGEPVGNNQVNQVSAAAYQRPVRAMKTNRGLLKFLLLGLITFGIYDLVVMSEVSSSINEVASRYDGKKTMHYCLLFFLVGPITLGIGDLVWSHRICKRMGGELHRRGINYHIGAGTFWLWGILGCLIAVGPLVYKHKFLKAMNLLAADYNVNG